MDSFNLILSLIDRSGRVHKLPSSSECFGKNALFRSGRSFKFDFSIYNLIITSQSTGKHEGERTGVRVEDPILWVYDININRKVLMLVFIVILLITHNNLCIVILILTFD